MTSRILYLHGFASGPNSQKANFLGQRLKELGISLEVPDLTEGSFARITITTQLRVVERLAGRGQVALIGSSLGGYVAALYAARHPEVERLVLLAPAFGFARRWSESLGREKLDEWERTGWLAVYSYADQRESKVSYELLTDGLQYEDFPQVSQPALLFHGKHDQVVPSAYSIQFAKDRSNIQLHIVHSGHELTDVLDEMWRPIRRFLLETDKD
jgi:pimeloyl-ACP methyl ester carboxylesterase